MFSIQINGGAAWIASMVAIVAHHLEEIQKKVEGNGNKYCDR